MPNITFHHPKIWNWSVLFLIIILSSFVFTVPSTTVHAAQVTLAWDRNAEQNVEGYKVYYGTASRDYDWFIDVGDVTSITITDLADGFTYYFAATAYDTATPPLESTYSDEVSKNTCSYSISPTNASFSASVGTGSVSITTQAGCPWTASSGAAWMTITSGSSGNGNGTVNYSITSNTGGSRTSVSTIAGRTFTVTQSGATTYTITASAGTGGSINPSGSVSVVQGGSQGFTIAANTGYQISNVTVDGVSQGAISSYTFSNVTAGHTISATFAVRTYTITASAGDGGTISPTGTVTVNHGTSQVFTIAANSGYQVSSVTVDGVSQGAITSYTFSNVTAGHTISATFAVRTYTITASAGTGGSISPSGAVSVNQGASQTFTIAANTGYTIAGVTVDGVPQGAISSYTFGNVTAAHTISATFSAITYTITASAGTGGTISPTGAVSVNHGTGRTFTINGSIGYIIADVLVDGVSVGPVSSYTFNNVTANHTISASFNAATYTISASAGSGGSISPGGSVTVNHGANQAFTITPDSGYGVTSVLVDGVSVGAVGSYTFSNVTGHHTITANFALNTFTINATAGTGGSISPSGALAVTGGTNQTFTIAANTGYRIVDVLVDGSSVGAVGSFTFTNVTSSHTISATLSATTYTITASAGVGGSISPSGSVTVSHGSNRTFSISPNTGYQILNVSVDGVSQGAVNSYTFSNVTTGHTISASFSVRTYTLAASAGTGGSISPSGSVTVNYGSSQTFTITPNAGYSIANVRVDGTSQGARSSYTFNNVTANHTISATFTAKSYTINASAGAGGAISPSGNVSVSHDDDQSFTITPASGYSIADVLVDGVSQGAVDSFIFTNVTANHSISASFSQITYAIMASAGNGGTISPSGSVFIGQGANQAFTIAPNSGYSISDVLVDGSSVGAVSSYIFTNVTSSHVISASFVEGYTLEVTMTGNGSGVVTPSPAATVYPPGTKVILRAEKDLSSTFEGFSGDCTSTRTSCTIVMTKHASVAAGFTLKTLKFKTTIVGNGTVTLEQPTSVQNGRKDLKAEKASKDKKSKHDVVVDYGDQLVYCITPEPGNYIKKVTVDRKLQGSVDSLTFEDVKKNHTVTVRFESEEKSGYRKNHSVTNRQIFFNDDDDQSEQQTFHESPSDPDDDSGEPQTITLPPPKSKEI